MSNPQDVLIKTANGDYRLVKKQVELEGARQNWLFDAANQNNPYWLTDRVNRKSNLSRVYGYVTANLKLTDDLNARLRYSIDRGKSDSNTELPATTQFPTFMMDYGVYRQGLSRTNEFYIDGLLSYNKEISDFNISANLGTTAHKITGYHEGMNGKATLYDYSRLILYKDINIFSPESAARNSLWAYETVDWDQSGFFTAQLGYKDYLFLEGSYRLDRYRAFEQFHQTRGTPSTYGYFSFGGNALVHKMVTLPKVITNFKLRASYSEVGNSIPNKFYSTAKSKITGAVIPSKYAYFDNPVPEEMKSFEAGFDMSFFRNSLNWDVTFYNAKMVKSYLEIRTPAGLLEPVNSGVIRNIGVETNVSYGMNLTKNLFWRSGINFSFNDNRIVETRTNPDGTDAYMPQYIGFGGKFLVRYEKGGRYGDFYGTGFEKDANGKIKLYDDGSPVLSSDQYNEFIGNMNSKYMLGWNNMVSYKNFKLNFLIDGRLGGKVVSFTEAFLDYGGLSQRTADARLAAENDPTLTCTFEGKTYPAYRMEDGQLVPIQKYFQGIGGDINATQYVYDATNFRLRELSLGYTFKNLLGKNKHLSLSVIGRNLFFLYLKAPIDPDTSLSTGNSLGGFDIFNMPTARSIGVSASVSF